MYYGMHLFSMSREQVLTCRYGEFLDLLAIHGIVNGVYKEKKKSKSYTFDEALALR